MISLTTSKISSAEADQISNSRPGVTLLLAILLLSAILAISFSLATILLFQVRTSEDFSKTEGALYAADGVGEQALFNTERQASTSTYVSSFNNGAVLNGQPVLSSTTTPIFQDKVLANSSFANSTNKYDFCGNTATTTGCGYGKLTLTYLPTGNTDPLLVYLCEFNPNTDYGEAPCTSTSTSAYWTTNSGESSVGTAYENGPSDPNGAAIPYNAPVPVTWTVNSALQQELILYDPATDGVPIYVSIQTYGPGPGYASLGLPISGKASVNIDAINGTTGRKIQVVVPNQ